MLPGVPALPLPTLTTALLDTLYADVERDPDRGDWGDVMMAFSVDTHNTVVNIPTNELRLLTTSSISTSDNPVGYVIVSGGVGRIYSAITHWMNMFAHQDPSIYDKLFTIEGELINNHGQVTEVDREVFNIVTTVVRIPTAAAIMAAIIVDPNITKMGPHATGDTDGNTVKVGQIFPVPHKLGGVFLYHKEVNWQTYFKVVYPDIVTEGKVVTYAPLTTLFSALSVGAPAVASVNPADRPLLDVAPLF